MRKMAPITLVIHPPQTEAGRAELARRVAAVHAAAVAQQIKSLPCPHQQKLALLDAVLETAKSRERTS